MQSSQAVGRLLGVALWVGALWVGALCGCTAADTPPAEAGLTLRFAALAAGGCDLHPNGKGELPPGIVRLAAQLKSGDDVSPTLRIDAAKISAGKWEIGPLQSLRTMDVVIYGCDAAAKVIYEGRTNNATVPDRAAAPVPMFLIPVGKMACTDLTRPRKCVFTQNTDSIGVLKIAL